MKSRLYAGVAAIALVASGATAQDLMVAPGEGAFTWDSFYRFCRCGPIFSGQTVTITRALDGE